MPAPESFDPNYTSILAPADQWFAITPSDSTDLAAKPRAVWVGTGGTLVISNAKGQQAALTNIASGTLLLIRPDRVLATGTTASNLVALY